MSKDEGYSEPNDSWATAADDISINEQQITSTKKGKLSAFGSNVVSSGRAEWDLQIDLESYGGICIGLYKHSKLTKKDDLTELPINSKFSDSENGWGFSNKTGAIIHNGERKKYGNRYRSNDTLTMSLDLLAGTLTYSINGESQGLAYDLPRGAYRLACVLPFKEQQVSIKRFWTSLPRDSNNSENNNNSNISTIDTNTSTSASKTESENEKKEENTTTTVTDTDTDTNTTPTITGNKGSLDDNNTDPSYDFDKNKDETPTAKESREVSKSLKKMAKTQSQDPNPDEDDSSESLEIIGGGVSRVRGASLSNSGDSKDDTKTDDTKVKTKKNANKSKAPEPINVPVKDDDEASDYFSVSGTNLSTEKPDTLSCIRQEKGVPHSGFGAQLVTHGRTEWILRIHTGHHIIIGVAGSTQHSDGLFTEYPYGFGYCDDGNIYSNDGYIEYNEGFKAGDLVGVHLDMDSGEVRFSVNKLDQGPAFKNLTRNDEIDGYRLAISLQYRPHSVQLVESTSWSTKRISPRPGNNTQQAWSFSVPHQRKLSWISQNKKSPLTLDDEKDDSNNDNNNNNNSNNLNPASALTIEKGNKKNGKNKTTNTNGDKPKRPKSARKAPKSPKMAGSKSASATTDNISNGNHTLSPSSYRKGGANNDSAANWSERIGSTDIWERSGPKLDVTANKNSISAKHDIKDGNSAIGKLVVSNNMKVRWDIHIDQGSRVTVGIMNMDGKSQTAMRKLLNSFFTNDLYGYGYFGNDGGIARNGRFKKYGEAYKRGDTVSVVLDLFNKTLSFLKNNEDQGVAFKNIPYGDYRVAITIPRNRHKITLTKVQIWDAEQSDQMAKSA